MQAISDTRGIEVAAATLRAEIAKRAYRELTVTWGFPSGKRIPIESFVLRGLDHDIYVGIGEERGALSHHFKLVEHGSEPTPAFYPNAEINLSHTGSPGVAGVMVTDGEQTLLCHRGLFNLYRGRIPRAKSLAFFNEYLVKITDGKAYRDVIPVVALGSDTFVADLESFVLRVIALKDKFKTGDEVPEADAGNIAPDTAPEDAPTEDPWRWNDGEEFEGTKSQDERAAVSYEYRHGPLCNRLAKALSSWANDRYAVRRTMNIDCALVDSKGLARVIFEVKTSDSLSEQLYKAVGQLLHYREKRGTRETVLVLVLPGEVKATASNAVSFFSGLGIHVLFEALPGSFQLDDGQLLEGLLNKYV